MTKNACTPDNVLGRMMGMREANGHAVTKELLDELDAGGKASYVEQANDVASDLFDQSEIKGAKSVGWIEKAIGDPVGGVKRILTDQAGVDEILGEDIVSELNDLVLTYMKGEGEPYNFSKASRKFLQDEEAERLLGLTKDPYEMGFKVEAAKILEEYAGEYEGTKAAYFKEYQEWMMEGGPLYAKQAKTGAGQAVANLGDNAIKSSFTVLLGNPLEVAIKLPALYPETTPQALAKWLGNGEFKKKIPELEEIGFYGLERKDITDASLFEKANQKWAGLNQTFDIPWKNLVYRAGEVNGGQAGGLKAVEDVLFNQRLANLPRQRWGQSGRVESKLLNYSINSIKLTAELIKGAAKGDAKAWAGLGIMTGMITALGGPGSLIPKPVEALMEEFGVDNPLPKWFASGLLQNQGIGRIAIPFDMANRQGQKAYKSFIDAGGYAQNEDYTAATVSMAHSLVSLAAFSQGWAGDAAVQKMLGLGRDAVLDDFEIDFATDARDAYFPFMRDAQ